MALSITQNFQKSKKIDEMFWGLCSSSFLTGELCSKTAKLQLKMSLRVMVLKGHRKMCVHKNILQFSQEWLLLSKAGIDRTGKELGLERELVMDKTPDQICHNCALVGTIKIDKICHLCPSAAGIPRQRICLRDTIL